MVDCISIHSLLAYTTLKFALCLSSARYTWNQYQFCTIVDIDESNGEMCRAVLSGPLKQQGGNPEKCDERV